MRSLLAVRLAALLLLAAPVPGLAAGNYWPTAASPSNLFGFSLVNSLTSMDAVADGSGGYFVSWDDGYNGHVQHVLSNGNFGWVYYQYQLPGNSLGFLNPAITSDGAGGVFVAFETHGSGDDLRVQRVTANGTPADGWPAAGRSLSPSSDYDYLADIVADGQGGALVTFIRSGPYQVYVQHVLGNGTLDPAWPADGVQVQKDGATYTAPRVLSDGEGGAMIFYIGTPYVTTNLVVARVDRDGVKRTEFFPNNGLPLSGGTTSTFDVVRTGDGLYGVVWSDSHTGSNEIYIDVLTNVERTGSAPVGGLSLSKSPATDDSWPAITTNPNREFLVTWSVPGQLMATRRQQDLSLHPEFPVTSAVVATTPGGTAHFLEIDSDATGGMVVAWHDPAVANTLRVQHLTGTGTLPAGWPATGQVMATNSNYIRENHCVFWDGDGGAISVFGDYNYLGTNRVRRDGSHGLYAPPLITAANDVQMDQGGKLSLYWRSSEKDTVPANAVGSYMVWRRMPPTVAQSRLASGARALAANESPEAVGPGAIRALPAATNTIYWEYLGSTPARGWPGYGMTVATNSDVFAPTGYTPWEVYIVEAVTPAGAVLATSEADSGYSIDNLSPALPAAFSAVRAGGATHLHWLRNSESDFRDFRLHRGSSASFVPSDLNLVAASADTGFVDAAATGFYYKLAATDVHGNSSGYVLVTPAQTLDVSMGGAANLAFAAIAPNPAHGHATLSFTLPAEAPVRLAVYDAQGRLVRTLVDATLPAGPRELAWELRDDAGRALAPGLYLARLSTPSGSLVRRLAVIE